MANRFPLTLDGTTVKELPSGDNLDLTGSGIANAGTVAATSVTVGGANALTTNSNLADLANVHTTTPTAGQLLAWDNANTRWAAADAAGGGAWNVISSTTVSSAVASVEFTLSGYENYALKFTNLNTSANGGYSTLRLQFSVDGGSNYLSTVYATRRHMGSYDNASESYHGRDNQVGANHLAVTDVYNGTNSNTDGMVFIYNNKAGVNNKTGIFHGIDSRGYGNVANQNPFYADGAYVVTNSSVINKVKWLIAGNNSYNISHGTYTLYGISTTV